MWVYVSYIFLLLFEMQFQNKELIIYIDIEGEKDVSDI